MPKLTKTDDELVVSLAGAGDFQQALNTVRGIPGRRFDGDRKLWCFPADPGIAERLLLSLKPTADASILQWVKSSRAEREAELTTKLPDDAQAPLYVPWSGTLYDYQRALIEFMRTHPKLIVGDDMGLGKSVQSLSGVVECLLHCVNGEQTANRQAEIHARVAGSAQGGAREVHEGVEGREQGSSSRVQSSMASESGQGSHSRTEREEHGQLDAQASNSNLRGEEQALQGLRDLVTSGGNESGSRNWRENLQSWFVAQTQGAAGSESIADDHGRTSEVRSTLSKLSPNAALFPAPILILCPASAMGVWQREARKWLGVEVVLVNAKTAKKRQELLEDGIRNCRICVCNWEQVRAHVHEETRLVKHRDGSASEETHKEWRMKQPLFADTEWMAIIADEAHRAKNRKAAQTRGLWMLQAPIMLALTGTPIQNSPDEIWSLLRWLYPEQYGNSTKGNPRTAYWSFHDQYTESYEGYGGSKIVIGVKNPDALRFELKNRLVRRTKAQKLNLPDKTREYIPLVMGKEQQKLYDEAETAFWLQVEQMVNQGDEQSAKLAKELLTGQRRIYEIPNGAARTVRLRQVLSSPALLGGADVSVKYDAIVENITDNSHQQHVVFTEFVEGANLLVARLAKKGITAEAFTGQVSDPQIRAFYEDKFQAGDIDVLVGTIGAMRESITLTAANIQHWSERAWVPAWNSQGEDRCHRVGQKNPVTILIYECENTVDTDKVRPTNQMKELIVGSVITQDAVHEKGAGS